jgi:hypothetical protein
MNMKKLPQNLRRRDCSVRDVGALPSRGKFNARRSLIDRCKRGAIGNAVCGCGAGESSTIHLKNLSYFNQRPRKKIEASNTAQLWLARADFF